jgi:hypothetical protein
VSRPRKISRIASNADSAAACVCSHALGVHDPRDGFSCYHRNATTFDCECSGFVSVLRSADACKRLHPLKGDNLYLYVRKSDGYIIRGCKACRRLSSAKWHRKHPNYNTTWRSRHPGYWADRWKRERSEAA